MPKDISLPKLNMAVGDVWWTLRDSSAVWVPRVITPYLGRLPEMPGTQVVKRSMVRTIVLVRPAEASSQVIIKEHICDRVFERLKHLLVPSKAAREWQMAFRLAAAGVPTIRPIACAERRHSGILLGCWLVCEAIPDVAPLSELLAGPLREWPRSRRMRLFEELAVIIQRMHLANVLHDDLHLGNVLCQLRDNTANLYIVDLHAARPVRWVTWGARVRNLVRVIASMLELASSEERQAFLESYVRNEPPLERFIFTQKERIERGAQAYVRWYQWSRTVRCLEPGTEFDVQWRGRTKLYFRRDFPPEAISEALRLHSEAVRCNSDLVLKSSPRGAVTIVEIQKDGRPWSVCVKESGIYGWRQRVEAMFRGSKARRIWVAANGLRIRNVAACELLAAGERRERGLVTQCFVVMKALEHCVPLDRHVHARLTYLSGRSLMRYKRAMAWALGRFVAEVHEKRIYHRDLKPSNIMVREGGQKGVDFVLMDLDRVVFDREVSMRRRARNLAQLDLAFLHRLSLFERMRCFFAYCSAGAGVRDRAKFFELVRAESERLRMHNRQVLAKQIAELKSGIGSP